MVVQRKAKHVFVINSRGKKPRKTPPTFGQTSISKLASEREAKRSDNR